MNANVRSRALQLWTKLAKASQIPINFIQNCLITDAAGRLLDKSLFVRKNAAAFLWTFLDYNPFGPSVSHIFIRLLKILITQLSSEVFLDSAFLTVF